MGEAMRSRRIGRSYGAAVLSVLATVALVLFAKQTSSEDMGIARDTGYSNPLRIESIGLSQSEIEERRRLRLSTKSPVRVVGPRGSQVLHGRFVHITDLHPDPIYQEGAFIDNNCHPKEKDAWTSSLEDHDHTDNGPMDHSIGSENIEKGQDRKRASKYGDAVLGCDSPMVLVHDSIKWMAENLGDKIDFVAWTGDNARHDNDRGFPRTENEIFEMNQHISTLMSNAFHDIPVVPTVGNNDVYPHNMFATGPTLQTREFYKIWNKFIPQSQFHTFLRGAYFFSEVVPDMLAILSVNTMYLFQSNPLVDNCDSKKQPGYHLFVWLGYVLKELRARGMKVWLIGHVPPNTKNYDISCLRKYILWTHEYRDVIIGGLFGHMNIDHFIPLDSVAAYKSAASKFPFLKGDSADSLQDNAYNNDDISDLSLDDYYEMLNSPILKDAHDSVLNMNNIDSVWPLAGAPNNKVSFMESLRDKIYADIKDEDKSGKLDDRYSVVHVSASVIPTFNPAIRVWEYNITGLDSLHEKQSYNSGNHQERGSNITFTPWDDFFEGLERLIQLNLEYDSNADSESASQNKDYRNTKKDKTLPPKMPSNAPLGPGYKPQTFTPERYVQYYVDLQAIGKGEKEFGFEYEYATDSEYKMPALTNTEWIKLARSFGKLSPESDELQPSFNSEDTGSEQAYTSILGNVMKRYSQELVSCFNEFLSLPNILVNKKWTPKKKKNKKKKKKTPEHDLKEIEKMWQKYVKHAFANSNYENMGLG
ncbi:Piso0_004885 [Millerozyma farinosa CBS 7064]|uniref:Endopolyphosphatase n=1 Tax=Pichia sorbitophila (strain ATCC MYA-4447 / BCRC 22081 / CBS 7064 / NBRC 10061 / NRRL Y-12695) TaxID=559304 RepID=G8Y3N1_PICSO|nr:Piso0_004885 [Millerozyma farinosa CBS 7064]